MEILDQFTSLVWLVVIPAVVLELLYPAADGRSEMCLFFFFQAEDGIRDYKVTGVQTCALPILFLSGHANPYIQSIGRGIDWPGLWPGCPPLRMTHQLLASTLTLEKSPYWRKRFRTRTSKASRLRRSAASSTITMTPVKKASIGALSLTNVSRASL